MATQADLDKLKAARIALLSGEAVQQVRFDGPPSRSVTFHPVDVARLDKLIAEIGAELAAASGRTSYILFTTSKGV